MVPTTATRNAPVNVMKVDKGKKADSPKLNDSQIKPTHMTKQNRIVSRSRLLRFKLKGGISRLNIKDGNARITVRESNTIKM